MLAITKIICDRVRPPAAFGHFLEGEPASAKIDPGIATQSFRQRTRLIAKSSTAALEHDESFNSRKVSCFVQARRRDCA